MEKTNLQGKTASTHPKRIAIYVIYDRDGILDGYRKFYLQELRKVVDRIVCVISGTITPESRKELERYTDDFFVRENKGLLTYSWINGIEHIGWEKLQEYDELLMLNDSFFGPFFPLQELMDAAEKSDADFYGSTKNFEWKSLTNIEGHDFKHGHLKGSICYFYIIKNRLLHSSEFRSYWSQHPVINGDFDTFFFNEFDFYDYVVDCGFKVASYQSDAMDGYMHDSLSHAMRKLIEDDRVPFCRIRPFGSDLKSQSIMYHYGKDTRETLDYIDKHTDYDINLIWDYILRTRNLTYIFNQLQLEYVVPRDSVEKPYEYKGKIGVILHIYYKDQVELLASYCENFPDETDFYITTIKDETKEAIEKAFSSRGLHFECVTRPNVGVAMSTLWVTYADLITEEKYEYICYFHDKKSSYFEFSVVGEQFGIRCFENLFGSEQIVKNIINLFEENKRLGVLGSPMVYHNNYFLSSPRCWPLNYSNTVDLAKKLDLRVDINYYVPPVAPYGDMFWFRSSALKKAIGYGFTYDDFDIPYAPDGTFMHAIERIYGFAAQDSGYYYAEVINTDNARSDLVNFSYMIQQFGSVLLEKGYNPYNFNEMMSALYADDPSKTHRLKIKHKIKKVVPPPLWKKMKDLYHKFGGKKWVG